MYISIVASLYVCIMYVPVALGGQENPWNWSCRQLLATVWILGTES